MKIEKEWVKYITEINIICKKYNETVNRNIASEVSIDTLKNGFLIIFLKIYGLMIMKNF